MKIATWNVNSVKARMPNLFDWLERTEPDVALLQETKCIDAEFPLLELQGLGYHAALHGQKTYNGVAVLSRRPILATVRGLPGNPEQGEARWIEAVLEGGVRVASAYVPMGQSTESDRFPFKLGFLDGIYRRLRQLLPLEEVLVVGGDFNVAPEPLDLYDPVGWEGGVHFHIEERRRIRKLLHLGMTDAFRARHPDASGCYTWWDYRGGMWQRDLGLRIDYLLLSPQAGDRLTDAGIDKWCRDCDKCSDHAPAWCALAE